MRSLAEWLVLPLFLAPVAVALGLGWLAREQHERELRRHRVEGAEIVRRWLALPDGPASWMPAHVARMFAPGEPARGGEMATVPFLHPTGPGAVRMAAPALGEVPWRLAAAFPAGLSPGALADPAVRLAIETGKTPFTTGGADEATRAFASLALAPDLDALRSAPLPAATKRYLVRRWRRAGHAAPAPALAQAERLLALLAAFEEHAGPTGVRLPAGAHEVGGLLALSTEPGGGPLLLATAGDEDLEPTVLVENGDADAVARLSWAFPPFDPPGPEEAGEVLWQGRLDAPLAGTFRLTAKHGGAWWRAPRTARWIAPAGALLLALLLLPAALLVALRRRRLHEAARVRFLNEVAHDLRTPLTALRLHADILEKGGGDEERRRRHVRTLTSEAARLSGLLENLLDLSRLERGEARREPSAVGVAGAIGRAVADFALAWPSRAADVRTPEGPTDARVRADASALDRCLANLLDNAAKHTPAGTPVRVTWRRVDGEVEIAVADEGPGVPPGERRLVFRRHVRGNRARAQGLPGSGLGLALVRDLAREMGGSVRLLETPQGAAFALRLPEAADA